MRPLRIAMIGAGSAVLARGPMRALLGCPELAGSRLVLHDIDPGRLADAEGLARHLARELSAQVAVEATADRARALDGAGYVFDLIQVGGHRSTVADFEIPTRHGLRQTIGDTLGIGGIMRALRTIPVLLSIARDMERLCPEALHLTYVNPMAMCCWALARQSRVRTVGLCLGVPLTVRRLARDLGVPAEELDHLAAGINHLAFFLRLEHQGRDLYPALRRLRAEGRVPPDDRVRHEVLALLGYFPSESSEHFAEYVPWFIRRGRQDLIDRYRIPLDEYLRRCEKHRADAAALRARLGDPAARLAGRARMEYGATIVRALETGEPARVHANVPNRGLIENLPPECVVEVPCRVDRQGLRPEPVGRLPPQLAAVLQSSVGVQALAVEAALTGRRAHVYHAAMLDPHTAAELDLDQIRALVDELLAAHAEWLPAGLRTGEADPS